MQKKSAQIKAQLKREKILNQRIKKKKKKKLKKLKQIRKTSHKKKKISRAGNNKLLKKELTMLLIL